MDPSDRLDAAAERARYETHENDPEDAGYRGFLDRLAAPLMERVVAEIPSGAEGLDFGSGPGPTLSIMLEERGMRMSLYDPFFAPDRSVLERTYDFVTCTETVEHLFEPRREFERFDRLVRPGGWLAIMTEWPPGSEAEGSPGESPRVDGLRGERPRGGVPRGDSSRGPVEAAAEHPVPDPGAFFGWYYTRDPSHTCFYGPRTLRWIAGHFGWELELPRANVAIFRVPGGTGVDFQPGGRRARSRE